MSVILKSGSSGNLADVTPALALKTDNSGVTQPVSVASLPLPTGASQDGTDGATPPAIPGTGIRGWLRSIYDRLSNPLSVTGTFFQATQPVSATSLPLPTNAAQETGGNLATISAAMTSGTAKTQTVSPTGTAQDVNAKAVQGTNFGAVQMPKDTGRVIKIFQGVFTPVTSETLVSLTPITDGVAGAAGTSFTVTAGKRLRIQAILLAITNTTAAIRGTEVTLRMTATGAVIATSPIVAIVGATTSAATINLAASQSQGFPDGIEFSGSMQIGVSANGTALAGSTVTVIGYEY